jgi:branched-chain amino acid aminotransferase
MSHIYESAYFGDDIIPFQDASLSIASSAVLYGLSVYTVFPIHIAPDGRQLAFRLHDHYKRLCDSARIIGIDTFEPDWPETRFMQVVRDLAVANKLTGDVFVRATVHVDELIPGTRSRGLHTTLSMFVYEAAPIVPQDGARLKTSVWRRIPDYAIPSRAKVNGAYVNSVLAKQDALDSGYDDCIFLDTDGHVCELSAANIFIVRHNTLITPDTTSDLLEGINRRTVIELAKDMHIPVVERTIDLTELYIADEVFVSGTSAYLAPVKEIDGRSIAIGDPAHILTRLQDLYKKVLRGEAQDYLHLVTEL